MSGVFGSSWGFCYDEKQFATQPKEFGLKKLMHVQATHDHDDYGELVMNNETRSLEPSNIITGAHTLTIEPYDDPSKAPNYNLDHPEFKVAVLDKVCIIKNGTVDGKATLDLQFRNQEGQRYVAMVTNALLKPIIKVDM